MSNSKKPLPVSKLTLWPLSAAIWRNENDKGEAFYGFTVERSYKDDNGNYQSSGNLGGRTEALLLEKLAGRVFDEICKLQAAHRQAQQTDE